MAAPPAPLARGAFRATLSGHGTPGPIEERIGRRLVRLVEPDSPEGKRLLEARLVDLIGPEGKSLGQLDMPEARARLRRRLEARLAEGSGRTRRHPDV